MILTKWIVFTGAACSGKTTILSYLQHKGFQIKGEIVREYLASRYGHNIPVESIPWGSPSFQSELLALKMKRESSLNPDELCLFDRGIFDVYAYSALRGISMEKIYVAQPYKYKAVFLFETLPIIHDDLRRDNEDEVEQQEKKLIEVYQSLDYSLIRVPRFSESKEQSILLRGEFVSSQIKNLFASNNSIY